MHLLSQIKTNTLFYFFLVVLSFFFSTSGNAFSDILVDSYCHLSILCLQKEASNFQELITLATQYQNDRETLNQKEEIKKSEFTQARDALFSSFGITATEYGIYMGKNGRAVNKYLAENPSIKQTIANLRAQINALMEQYERLKGEKGTPALPVVGAPALQE